MSSSEQWMIVLAILLLAICQPTDAECSKVVISKTMWQSSREGTYIKTNDQCLNRNVYKQHDGDNYLYYIEATGGWRGWMVGGTSCQNSGGIAVQDDSLYPEQSSNIWEEVYNGNWYYNYQLEIGCYHLSSGAIAGIVIGCLLVVIIVVIIVICCCKTTKRSNVVQVSRTPTVTYTTPSSAYNRQHAFLQTGYYPGTHSGYYLGPPVVQGYGPPPVYTAAPPSGVASVFTVSSRPPSSPPAYAAMDAASQSGQRDGYVTKVSD